MHQPLLELPTRPCSSEPGAGCQLLRPPRPSSRSSCDSRAAVKQQQLASSLIVRVSADAAQGLECALPAPPPCCAVRSRVTEQPSFLVVSALVATAVGVRVRVRHRRCLRSMASVMRAAFQQLAATNTRFQFNTAVPADCEPTHSSCDDDTESDGGFSGAESDA